MIDATFSLLQNINYALHTRFCTKSRRLWLVSWCISASGIVWGFWSIRYIWLHGIIYLTYKQVFDEVWCLQEYGWYLAAYRSLVSHSHGIWYRPATTPMVVTPPCSAPASSSMITYLVSLWLYHISDIKHIWQNQSNTVMIFLEMKLEILDGY